MLEPTPSNTVTPTGLSPSSDPKAQWVQAAESAQAVFATAPIHSLLKQPLHELDENALRAFVQTMRTARTSQQTYSKHLRIDSPKEGKPSKDKVKADSKLADEYLNDL